MHRPLSILLVASATLIGACGELPDTLTDPVLDDGTVPRLLSDEELRTPEDPNAPAENPSWSQWVVANHHTIRSLTHDDFSDLAFLRPRLQGRRVVQLGESGHGVREFSQAKVRLIKYLHRELGYSVVAFESSLFGCYLADGMVDERPPLDVLDACLFPVWRTEAVLELFEYIESTRGTANPLRLAGFDTQVSSRSASALRPAFLGALTSVVDPEYGARVEELDREFLANYQRALAGQYVYAKGHRDRLVAAYDSLATFFDSHRPAFQLLGPDAEIQAVIGAQTARSMVAFVEQLAGEGHTAVETRDDGMADNLEFLLDELYPGERLVVWAHNFHVRHANDRVEPAPQPRTMGRRLEALLGDDLYSVGLYMYGGMASSNDGIPYAVEPAVRGSLASILYRARKRWTFYDLAGSSEAQGSDWMDARVVAKTWGVSPLTLVPRDQYDGVLFVHTTTSPRYIPIPIQVPS